MDTPKHRVLIVDDDERIRRTHARLFASFGYDIETAADGIEALSKPKCPMSTASRWRDGSVAALPRVMSRS